MSAAALRFLVNAALLIALVGAVVVALAAVTGQFHASHWPVVTDHPAERPLVTVETGDPAGMLYMSRGAMIVRTGGALQLLQILHIALIMAAVIATLWLLRKIVACIADGAPFDRANVRRLRLLGFLFIAAFAWMAIEAALAQWLLLDRVALADGARLLPSISSAAPGTENVRLDFDLEFGWLIGGLVALVLAEAFRLGTLYREDSEEVV